MGDLAGYINEDVKISNVEAKGISASGFHRRQYARRRCSGALRAPRLRSGY
jgi:hypothetical protein